MIGQTMTCQTSFLTRRICNHTPSSHKRTLAAIAQLTALLLLLALSALTLLAQTSSSGGIVGTVTDNSGAVILGASITAVDVSTNDKRVTSTNSAGRYVFANLPPGIYELSVAQTGFKAVKVRQNVDVGLVATANISLEIGAVSQVVEVEASGAQLQTMN